MHQPQLFDDPTARPPEKAPQAKRLGWKATPAPIGSGPPGETCKTCQYMRRVKINKTYLKCYLMVKHWSFGGATDVRAGWDACREWLPEGFENRMRELGEFACQIVERMGTDRQQNILSMFVIADYYEERGQDMGWLRHVANKLERTGGHQ